MKWLRSVLVAFTAMFALQAAASAQSISWNVGLFSRANCGNNESINWERSGRDWWQMEVASFQVHPTRPSVSVSDGPRVDWRVAAISWFSSVGGDWTVTGDHYMGVNPDLRVEEQMVGVELLQSECTAGWAGNTIGGVWYCKMSSADSCNASEW